LDIDSSNVKIGIWEKQSASNTEEKMLRGIVYNKRMQRPGVLPYIRSSEDDETSVFFHVITIKRIEQLDDYSSSQKSS
jgi:hypothetical protein